MSRSAASRSRRRPYLFLLAQPSSAVRGEAATRLKELGLTVVAQYGRVAVEALASTEQAASARDLGLFSLVLGGAMKGEHFERLNDEQASVVRQWNVRFTPEYRETVRDRRHLGRSWGDPDLQPPAPYTPVELAEFEQFVEDFRRRTGRRPWGDDVSGAPDTRFDHPLRGDAFIAYERELADRLDDPTAAYHLARMAARFGAEHRSAFLRIDREFLEALLEWLFRAEATCWEMTGEMSVGLVFVESARAGGPGSPTPNVARSARRSSMG